MRSPLFPVLLVAVSASLVGGAAVAVLGPGEAPVGEPTARDPALVRLEEQVAQLGVDELRAELLRLGAEVRDLEYELSRLEARGPAPLALDDAGQLATLVQRSAEESALAAVLEEGTRPTDEGFASRVADVLADIRAKEDEERDQRRAERRAAEFEARLTDMVTQLGLDTWQKERMREALTTQETKREEIFDQAREGGGWTSMRASFDALNASTREGLSAFLSLSQLESWDALPRRGGFDFGRGDGPLGGR